MSNDQIKQIADLVAERLMFCTKDVLTSDEAARYMGISRSYLYKLTMRCEIPFYKPTGKVCYFKRSELEEYLLRNRCASAEELNDRALNYCRKHPIPKSPRTSPVSRKR